ncbi:MAG: peptidoglycan DD-metalloendopeptidase family protein [Ilumatobacteraceae bacterium]
MPVNAVFALVLSLLAPPLPPPPTPPGCLLAPVAAPIVDRFREPPCPWCPGNRGLEYGVAAAEPVRAAAAGTVTFNGVVAGTRYLVVEHVDGLRATYGRLDASPLIVDQRVLAGAVVGLSGDDGLYFGLRRGDGYIDPQPLLGRLVERWRLLPTDGSTPRSAPPPRWRCPGLPALGGDGPGS